MNRIVGIDYGRKRTGLAVTDPTGIFAHPLETVPTANIINYLKTYAEKETLTRFVIGYPMNLNGKPSEAAPYVDSFIRELQRSFPDIPVTKEDERFTSVLAFRSLIDSGVRKMERRDKSAVDKVSASLILQTFMDRQQNNPTI